MRPAPPTRTPRWQEPLSQQQPLGPIRAHHHPPGWQNPHNLVGVEHIDIAHFHQRLLRPRAGLALSGQPKGRRQRRHTLAPAQLVHRHDLWRHQKLDGLHGLLAGLDCFGYSVFRHRPMIRNHTGRNRSQTQRPPVGTRPHPPIRQYLQGGVVGTAATAGRNQTRTKTRCSQAFLMAQNRQLDLF